MKPPATPSFKIPTDLGPASLQLIRPRHLIEPASLLKKISWLPARWDWRLVTCVIDTAPTGNFVFNNPYHYHHQIHTNRLKCSEEDVRRLALF